MENGEVAGDVCRPETQSQTPPLPSGEGRGEGGSLGASPHPNPLPEGEGTRAASNVDADRERPQPRLVVGGLCVVLGLVLLFAIIFDVTSGLPFALPPGWYTARSVWFALSLTLLGVGWRLQRPPPSTPCEWNPTHPGRRFQRLLLYSRDGCHLCDDAKATLATYSAWLPPIEEIDIAGSPDLEAQFGTSIPVVELDGIVRFRGRVSELLLRRLIDGTTSMENAEHPP